MIAIDSPYYRRLATWLFVIVLPIWTILLVRPHPLEGIEWEFEWSKLLIYLANKSVHIAGYAGLAFTGLLTFHYRHRYWVILGLCLHGGLTELGQHYGNQYFQTHRYGTFRDVIIDTLGIGLGVFVLYVFRRLQPKTIPTDNR